MDKQKILFIDIETAPHLSYVWEKWETNVIAFKEYGYLLCYAYKWLGDKKVTAVGGSKMSTKKLVESLYKLFNEAEIIVAHNGDSFDIKMANQYFIKEGFSPPHQYKTVDTKKLAKSKFRFVSNKLDDLGDYLGLGRKINTGGFELWQGCMNGNQKAWKKMLEYNRQDVALLEKVYNKLVPWCKHPIVHVLGSGCRVCGGKSLQQRGWMYQDSGKSKRKKFSCNSCGRWSLGELQKN